MKYKGKDINELDCEEMRMALRDTLMKATQLTCDLIAIKTGVINVAPENISDEWTVKRINTLRDAQRYAGEALKNLNYK